MKLPIAILTAVLATSAIAAPEYPFQDWDTNGDGLLSKEESAELQYYTFDIYDSDEDGDLTRREREGFEADLAFGKSRNPAIGLIAEPDANGDGLISAGEFKAWTGRVFDLLDQSGDGNLSRNELMAQRP